MNCAHLTEYSKLGLTKLSRDDLAYRDLKCPPRNVHRIEEQEPSASPLYATRFCNVRSSCHLLAVANEDGAVRVHNTQTGASVANFRAHHNAIFDLVWLENEVKFVTSSGDYSTVLWDLSNGEPTAVVRMVGHLGSVKGIACKPGDPNVFATGARDGSIMQWDIRSRPYQNNSALMSVVPDKVIKFSHLKSAITGWIRLKNVVPISQNAQCIASVVYQNTDVLISCSSTDKFIKVWDSRKSYTAYKGVPAPLYTIVRGLGVMNRSGYTSLAVSPCKLKLFAYCTDANIYCFNVGTYSSDPLATYNSSNSSSYFCKINLSPDGRFLSSGSPDEKAYIWSVADPGQRLVSLEGHSAEVTSVDWCQFGALKLASCSDDGTYRIWENIGSDPDIEQTTVQGSYATYHQPQVRKPRPYFASHISSHDWLKKESKTNPLVEQLPNYVITGESPHRAPTPKLAAASPANDSSWLKKRKLSSRTPPLKPCNKVKRPRKDSTVRENLLKYFTKPLESSEPEASYTS